MSPGSDSSFGFWIQLFFQFVFVGIGCAAIGFAYFQYRQGAAMQQIYVFAGVGAVFVLFSGLGLVRTWRARKRAGRSEQHEQRHADVPWRVRPEWRSAELVEARPPRSENLLAILWNAVAWPIATFALYTELLTSPDPNWALLLVLLFPLVGLALAWQALRRVLHRRKFGTAVLVMEDMPGRLGKPLRMRLKTGVRPDEAPDEGFCVRLSCYRRSIRYTTDSDGDSSRRVEKDLLWRDEKRVRGRPEGSRDRLEVLTRFELPSESPPSTPEKRENRIMWMVEVEADLPGLDFQTDFEIPVFATERSDGQPDVEYAPHGEETVSEASHPYGGYEVGTTFDEPVSSGIGMRRRSSGGLELHFAAGRNKLSGGMFAGFALIMAAIAVVAFVQGSFLGMLFFLLLAGLPGYAAWTLIATASTLTIEDGTVTLVRGPLGRGTPVRFSCADLADVSVKASGHAGSTTYYNLTLHRLDMAARQRAAAGEETAEKVAQFIGNVGLVGGAEADEAAQKIRQSIHAQSTQVTVAQGLSDKQEADWLAAAIQQAAQREATFS